MDTKELRRLAQAATPGPWWVNQDGLNHGFECGVAEINSKEWHAFAGAWTINGAKHSEEGAANAEFIAAANPATVIELLDRLEAAEKERDEFKRECFGHISDNSLLRAKIEAMERQTPVAKVRVHQIEARGYRDIGTDLTDDALAAIHMLGIIKTYGKKEPQKMRGLFCDCKTDEEKSTFFLSGRAVETGVIAAAISNDVAMAYHRCSEFKKEINALRAKVEAMEEVAIWKKRALEAEDLNRK